MAAMASAVRGMMWHMIKRVLTPVNAKQCPALPHITATVFINDDEYGLHHDYEVWLEELAPHAPIRQYRHNDTGEDACPSRTGSPTRT
jgi:thiamine phosphate synthase YjbQ (UPF0047 family)